MKNPDPSPIITEGGEFGTAPFWLPNCFRKRWISGGRLLDWPEKAFQLTFDCAILALTETTAGLTLAMSGENEGIASAWRPEVTMGAACAAWGAVSVLSPIAPAATSERIAADARMRARIRGWVLKSRGDMMLRLLLMSPDGPPGRSTGDEACARPPIRALAGRFRFVQEVEWAVKKGMGCRDGLTTGTGDARRRLAKAPQLCSSRGFTAAALPLD